MKKIILLFIILLSVTGCTASMVSVPLECRHQAVACAIAVQEKYPDHEVKIAFGPAKNKTDLWHAQAKFRLDDDPWVYVAPDGSDCIIGKREEFTEVEHADVNWYIKYRILMEKPVTKY